MTVALVLSALLLQIPAAPPTDGRGWVRPERSDLTRLFGMRWKAELADPPFLVRRPEEWTAPYITRDHAIVLAATAAGRLEARALADGELLWKRTDLPGVGAAMGEVQGRVLLSAGSNLLALAPDTGRERWRLDLQGGIGGPLVVTGTVAVLPVRSNTFVAVDGVKGTLLWRVKRPTPDGITMRGQAPAALDVRNDRAYLGFSDGALVAVSLSRGEVLWTAQLGRPGPGFSDVDAEPVLTQSGRAVLAASYSGGLYALDASNGRALWKKDELAHLTHLSRAGASGLIIASQADGMVLGLDDDGRVHWRYRMRKGAPGMATPLGRGLIAVGSSHGPTVVLEERTGKPHQLVATGAGSSAPVAWRDPDLAIFSNRGLLLVLRYGRGLGITH